MMFIKHYAPNRCLCTKVAKSTMCNYYFFFLGGGGGGGRVGLGGQGGYLRSEAFVKIQEIFFFFFGGGGGGGGGSGRGGGGGRVGGVRVDVN